MMNSRTNVHRKIIVIFRRIWDVMNFTVRGKMDAVWNISEVLYRKDFFFFFFFFFFFHRHYSPLWALACRTMYFHFFLSATNCLHLLTPSTWRSLSTSSFHLFLGLPLLLVPSSSWVKIFLGILSSSILSRRPKHLILCPFIHFTIFSPSLFSSSSISKRRSPKTITQMITLLLFETKFCGTVKRNCSTRI